MRTIKTTYLLRGRVIHTNSGTDANRAVAQCVLHMQSNHYGADVAEVYDTEGANVLHAQVKLRKNGRIEIIYKRNPLAYETKYAAAPLLIADQKHHK